MSNPLPEDIQQRAKACNRPQYHIANQVQPHYVVLVMEPASLTIQYASDNGAEMFGKAASAIIHTRLTDWLTDASQEQLLTMLEQEATRDAPLEGRLPLHLQWQANDQMVKGILYRNADHFIAELETSPTDTSHDYQMDLLFFKLAQRINTYTGPSHELAHAICRAMHTLLGFDRVWYCEFDTHENGYVSGEYNLGALPSLLHHHFPATDVPQAVRKIYIRNKSRAIADASATAAQIIDAEGHAAPILDLTYSLARMPAATHLEYLANMGVQASASFSVVRDSTLVGLFGAHHTQPRRLSARQLTACQYLADKFLIRYDLLHQQEEIQHLHTKETDIDNLLQHLEAQGYDLAAHVVKDSNACSALLNADGCLYIKGQKLYGREMIPPAAVSTFITLLAAKLSNQEVWHTTSLKEDHPELEGIRQTLCGLLAIRLGPDEALVWYRHEQIYNERWAGNPSQAVREDESGRVGPRTSFDSWVRKVEGTSTPWQGYEQTVAEKFRGLYLLKHALHLAECNRAEAEKANAYKSRFLANMSHELRTPLHTMIGFAESIETKIDCMPQTKQRQYLGIIHQSGERLLTLINDLLDLSKLEAGMMVFSFTRQALTPVVQQALQEVQKPAEDKSISVSLDMPEDDTFVFDQARMMQVMVNLLSNAITFSPEGGNITITASRQASDLVLSLSDEGKGIPENEIQDIFNAFVQSRHSASKAGGTGLGLSICQEIIAAHHGQIRAENRSEGGATFTLTLPLQQEETYNVR